MVIVGKLKLLASSLSVPIAQSGDQSPQSGVCSRHHVHPDEARLRAPVRDNGLGPPTGSCGEI